MTDFSALCAELLNGLVEQQHPDYPWPGYTLAAMDRARAALAAEPQGEGLPTVMQIIELSEEIEAAKLGQVDLVRAALAVRPLLEQVARMGDRIGQHTVGEIMVPSDRAAAWLRENPPGQPIAIEPRGCPTPGACSCVEPAPPADGEVAELVEGLRLNSDGMSAIRLSRPATMAWIHPPARVELPTTEPQP